VLLKKIVIAEDDDAIAHMVNMALGDAGFLCLRARDGDEALKLVKAHDPDLLVLDVMMPAMDGPTLYRKMKTEPATSALPVVFITAKAAQRDLDELTALGAAGTISKPFSPKDLPDQLRAIWAKLP